MDTKVDGLGGAVGKLDMKVDNLERAVNKLDTAIAILGGRVGHLASSVEDIKRNSDRLLYALVAAYILKESYDRYEARRLGDQNMKAPEAIRLLPPPAP